MISSRIPRGAVLDLMTLLASPRSALPFPLDAPTTRLFSCGRVALLHGLQMLKIRAGDNILMPSFICKVVMAPLNTLGIRVRYYEIDDHLQPKFETAAQALDSRTRAFLGVHYFGFPQNVDAIMDFCNEHQLCYIEDNTHGFLSASGSRLLGTYGDIAIFSLRKTLALPNGGALVVNNPKLALESKAVTINLRTNSSISSSLKFLLRSIALNLDVLPCLDIASFCTNFARLLTQATDEERDLSGYLEKFSSLANSILIRTDFNKVKQVRRTNYFLWHKILENLKAQEISTVFDRLPEGVVPLGLPVRVQRRSKFVEQLNKQGIGCYAWPKLPSDAPRTRLSDEVAVIPLHRHPPSDVKIPYRS